MKTFSEINKEAIVLTTEQMKYIKGGNRYIYGSNSPSGSGVLIESHGGV